MTGIVFFRTARHDTVVDFYMDHFGATVWIDQPDCTILDHEGFKFGFCARETADDCGVITFVYDDRAAVDAMYEDLVGIAGDPPRANEKYEIYQFFAEDPDGRTVECQTFLHETE